MSLFYLLREGAPFCVCNVIFISLLFIISILILAGGTIKTGKTFEEILFFKIEAILKVFLNSLLALGIIILIIILPISTLFYIGENNDFENIRPEHIFLVGILLLAICFLVFGLFRRSVLKRKMWKTFCDIIPNLRTDLEPMRQDRLLTLMTRLKMLVGFISGVALLVALWGFVDLFILFFTDAMYELEEGFLVMLPVLKLSIAFILYFGTYFLMVRPLNKIKFWDNVMLG